MGAVIAHILSLRPELRIFQMGYDYFAVCRDIPDPPDPTDPVQVAAWLAECQEMATRNNEQYSTLYPGYVARAAAMPGLDFAEFRGTMQMNFAFAKPYFPDPGPLAAPDATLPSPVTAMPDVLHPNAVGQALLAGKAWDAFYAAELAP